MNFETEVGNRVQLLEPLSDEEIQEIANEMNIERRTAEFVYMAMERVLEARGKRLRR